MAPSTDKVIPSNGERVPQAPPSPDARGPPRRFRGQWHPVQGWGPTSRAALLALAVPLLLVAGCIGDDAEVAPLPDADAAASQDPPAAPQAAREEFADAREAVAASAFAPQPRLRLGDRDVSGTAPLFFTGDLAAPDLPDPEGACAAGACAAYELAIEVPDGYWEAAPGALEVSLTWETTGHERFALEVRDAAGEVLARADVPADILVFEAKYGEIPVSSHALLLDEPASGAYTIIVEAVRGAGPFQGAAQIEPAPAREGPLLPNLVTLAPTDLRIESPAHDPITGTLLAAAGLRGCGADEALEASARRCLRFSNSVGNVGTGPLEARLPAEGGIAALARAGPHFLQRIHDADGGFEDIEVGAAEFHAAHGHFHYEGLAQYELYAYDAETGARGELVSEGRKVGFCVADIGLVEPGALGTVPRAYFGEGCLTPDDGGEFWMGIAPGWFDIYWWSLPDQYVEITGVDDGVYELVSTTNADGTLIESDRTDNEASVVILLEGDDVRVLAPG